MKSFIESFLTNFGNMLDFTGPTRRRFHQSDDEAIASDWAKVGSDIQFVINKFEQDNKETLTLLRNKKKKS